MDIELGRVLSNPVVHIFLCVTDNVRLLLLQVETCWPQTYHTFATCILLCICWNEDKTEHSVSNNTLGFLQVYSYLKIIKKSTAEFYSVYPRIKESVTNVYSAEQKECFTLASSFFVSARDNLYQGQQNYLLLFFTSYYNVICFLCFRRFGNTIDSHILTSKT